MWELDYKENAEEIDAFELWCWKRLVRVPWTARRSNQSILKEISPEYSLEYFSLCWSQNSNTLTTWWEELPHLKRSSCWKRLKARGEGDDRECDGWMASLTQWTWVWVSSGSWWWQGNLVCCSPRGRKESDMTEWLNWLLAFHALQDSVNSLFWEHRSYSIWGYIMQKYWWFSAFMTERNILGTVLQR